MTYEISTDVLEITEKSKMNYSQYSIPFENIGKRVFTFRRYKKDFLHAGIACVLASIIGTIVLIFDNSGDIEPAIIAIPYIGIIVFLILYLRSKTFEKHIEILDTKPSFLILKENDPDENEVKRFIDLLINSRNQYLKDKYAYIDHDLPQEENVSRLRFLYDNDIISKDEYEEMKIKIKYGN